MKNKKKCTLNLETPTGFIETFFKEVLEVGEHFCDKATALLVHFQTNIQSKEKYTLTSLC